jgi:glycogen debranching enzyme
MLLPIPLAPEAAGGEHPTERRAKQSLFALKFGNTFIVNDAHGDIFGDGDGLFHDDTRVLSGFRLTLAHQAPSLLGARISQDNVMFTTNLTNHPLPPLGGESTPKGVIHIERVRMLWESVLYERLRFTNYGDVAVTVPLEIHFAADFHDMFEVRGRTRQQRGVTLPAIFAEQSVCLRYRGLDGVERTSWIGFSQPPRRLTETQAELPLAIGARRSHEIYIDVGVGASPLPSRARFRTAAARARWGARAAAHRSARVHSSARLFDSWMDKSNADLALLTTRLSTGLFPYAGIPWFSTPFGRDAIITALQTLWIDPALAQGVLTFLARSQATETSTFQDAAPGKILHETRGGEMALLREVPFAKYYGSVDGTPLFVVLAGAFAARTGDMAFISTIWSSLRAAMDWIEGAGDSNRDGFVDYARAAETGLANQGWKDSQDSVFHADGTLADGPIALIEVQGYVFAALTAMAELAGRRGDDNEAAQYSARAKILRERVEARFWIEDLGTYAIALDGAGRPCRIRSSNAGQLLFSGLPAADRAAKVADMLLGSSFNSGWGIRTLARGEVRFNPMSYHNGSVWPHDTALCAAGLSRYGHHAGVVQIATGMFDAAIKFDMRLPELFCGFPRSAGEAPIAYPVACLPQAWAAGSAFMLLQACLGLRIDGWRGEIHIFQPQLPVGLDQVTVSRLAVGDLDVAITFQRVGDRVDAFLHGADGHGTGQRVPLHVHR